MIRAHRAGPSPGLTAGWSSQTAQANLRAGPSQALSGDVRLSFSGLSASPEDARRFFADQLGSMRLRLPPPLSVGVGQGSLLRSLLAKGQAAPALGPAEARMLALLQELGRLQDQVRQAASGERGMTA